MSITKFEELVLVCEAELIFDNKPSDLCPVDECKKRSTYGYKADKIRLYCAEHRLQDMVYLDNRICIKEDCNHLASFNYLGDKTRLYCSKHKLKGMIHMCNKKRNKKINKKINKKDDK